MDTDETQTEDMPVGVLLDYQRKISENRDRVIAGLIEQKRVRYEAYTAAVNKINEDLKALGYKKPRQPRAAKVPVVGGTAKKRAKKQAA